MLSAYTDFSISAKPTDVRTAPCSSPRRMACTTSGSSPFVPPPYRMIRTRPFDSLFHLSATSFSERNHEELVGTSVAILTVSGCAWASTRPCDGNSHTAAQTAKPATHTASRPGPTVSLEIIILCLPSYSQN